MASVSEKQMAMAMEKMEKAKGVQAPVVVVPAACRRGGKACRKGGNKKGRQSIV